MLPMKIDGRLQIFDEAARQSSLTHPRCCAADRPVRDARVSQAIGQSFDWLVPAKAEVFGARVADRPAAFPLAELEQRASAPVVDGLWGAYQWLDRAPKGRNETAYWWRRHDEYDKP